jgi:dihydrofolate synthase/folylpolyglutamate synthase
MLPAGPIGSTNHHVSRFPDFAAFEAHLDALGFFRMELGLARMAEFLRRAGLERPPFAAIQVVGTNGKGSTAAFAEAIGRAHGRKTGLFTSPHFLTFRERVRVDGAMLPEADWLAVANLVMDHAADLELTYFEVLTACSLIAFREHGVEFAVLEAGLGGSHDATSAPARDLVLFTSIGLDHMHVLGDSAAEIARDKTGALAGARAGISAPQSEEVAYAMMLRAKTLPPSLTFIARPSIAPRLGLFGPHQPLNAMLAAAGFRSVARLHGWDIDEAAIRAGLAETRLPGRLQLIGDPPRLILDAAHNVPAMRALAKGLNALDLRPRAAVFACLSDKDVTGLAGLMRAIVDGPVFVPPLDVSQRAIPPAELAARLGERGRAVDSVAEALEQAAKAGEPVLMAGSLFLLADFYRLHPQHLNA